MDLKKLLEDTAGKSSSSKLKLLLGLAAVGVILILLGSLGSDSRDQAEHFKTEVQNTDILGNEDAAGGYSAMEKEEEYLSAKLEEMLSQVEGAGDVQVTVSLKSSTRSEYAVNNVTSTKTTQEKDQSGGTRVVTEDSENGQVVLVQSQGGQIPLIKHSSGPDIAGVLVVAEGAKNPKVKAKLFNAARVAFGVEPHKILVVAKER